ncbi:HNH endonuclease [Actinocorallia sp. API 0066]|uniref:HNH endonuclease n=1 Tax=Actinocorallia sp. API 0066 TaxID=2896846 RepID=UPI001E5DB4D1|nr:HNH endonuclease signature motif containing protein [Actinocorallia sp. API 0066]MCD0450394.1 HNH endonuclease [Actinocorallia sp. API 0066]
MGLRDLNRAAVLAAVEEFDFLGREEFLAKYRFGRARKFFLVLDGREYDSKAVAGAAHGRLPGSAPLAPADFSGGEKHTVDVLRNLGFEVRERGAERPGPTGAIEAVERLPRHTTPGGEPMLKHAVVLLWAVGRALADAPRILPWTATYDVLLPLLTRFRRDGENPRVNPARPISALYHVGLWELNGFDGPVPTPQGHPRAWFDDRAPQGGLAADVHGLIVGSPIARLEFLEAVVRRFRVTAAEAEAFWAAFGLDADPPGEAPEPGAQPDELADYTRYCDLAEDSAPGLRRPVVSRSPVRSAAARRAVLARSRGHCEYCGDDAPGRTDAGDPVLEIDHVRPLAEGGRDHPEQMIALCPNCHAVKTRGTSRHELTEALRALALRLHLETVAKHTPSP